jgi:hypothetical protein
MEDDLEAVDIVLAQRLASGEPNIRKRAFKLLHEHMKEESAKKGLENFVIISVYFPIFQHLPLIHWSV